VESGALLRKLPPATASPPSVLAFDERDERVAMGGQDGDLTVWSLTSDAPPTTLRGRPHPVSALAFAPDGKQLFSGDYERFIDVFDLATGRMQLTSPAHVRAIYRFAFSPDGALLASASSDGTVALHTVEGLKPLGRLKANGAVLDVAFTDHKALRTVTTEGDVALWDLGPTVERLPIVNDTSFVIALAGAPDGKTIAFATTGGSMGVRAWPGPAVRRKDEVHYYAAAFSPDGKRLAMAETDKVKVHRVEGTQLELLEEHPLPCEGLAALGLALARDGTIYAACGKKLLAGRGGAFTELGLGDLGNYTVMALSPDGTRLAWAGETRLLLYDLAGKRPIAEQALAVKARAVTFSPDGKLLAYGGFDRLAHVLDAATGKALLRLEGHLSPVFDLAFAPDSQTLATASLDRSVRLWDARTGEAVGRLPALNYEAMSVEWPQPGLIVVGDSVGTVTFSPIDRSRLTALGSGAAAGR
jgi:WD40 repeat protein